MNNQTTTQSTTIIPATAMPPQPIQPLAAGATSPMQSAQIQQQQQINKQMALIGKGGAKRRKSRKLRSGKLSGSKLRGGKLRGGANGVANNSQILVPPLQTGAVNHEQTAGQYADLTALASKQQSQAVYDRGNTAAIAASQQGGKRLKGEKRLKGGMWPVWGCLSGGKQTRRRSRRIKRSSSKRKYKRNTRNKRHH